MVVEVVGDQQSRSADASGKNLVVISESVSSGRVGDKFNGVSVPVLVYESYLYDNLSLTGKSSSEYGALAGQSTVNVSGSNVLTGDQSGIVSVSSSSGTLSWGKPGVQAIVAATLAGDASKAVIFGYEAGALLADGRAAPARRVAFYPNEDSLNSWTADARRLFDSAVQWALGESISEPIDPQPVNRAPVVSAGSDATATVGERLVLRGVVTDDGVTQPLTVRWTERSGASFTDRQDAETGVVFSTAGTYQLELVASDTEFTVSDSVTITVTAPSEPPPVVGNQSVLFVVGSPSLSAADRTVQSQLQSMDLTVSVVDDQQSKTSDASGKDLVIISESVISGNVGNKFNSVSTPVLVYESYLYDNLSMTGTASSDFGALNSQTRLAVTGSSSLSAGLSGLVTVSGSSGTMSWGRPGVQAQVAATLSGDSNKAVIFGYESGAALADGKTAPARRVGFYPNMGVFSNPTTDGLALFSAAVQWALGSSGQEPTNPQPTNKAPVVSAGTDRNIVAGATIKLNASVSDDGVTLPLSVSWSQRAGILFEDRGSVSSEATFATAGTYVLELVASDTEFTVTDTVTIVVTDDVPANQAPAVSAGPDASTTTGQSLTLAGSVDDDGVATPLSIQWSALAGVNFVDRNDPTTQVSFSAPGSYALELVASDTDFVVKDTVLITVTTVSQPPASQNYRALFVVGNTSLSAGDRAVLNQMESHDVAVTVVGDQASKLSDASGMDLLVISESVVSGRVGGKFTPTTVPVLVYESYLYDDMSLTAATSGEFGALAGQQKLAIAASGHALAAGLNGQVTVNSRAGTLSWGRPGAQAQVAATTIGDSQLATIFAYEKGALLANGQNAPARRVAFYPNTGMDSRTAAGEQLFEAAMVWALGASTGTPVDPQPVNQAPVVSAGEDARGIVGVAMGLEGAVIDDAVATPLTIQWKVVSGASFTDRSDPATAVTFSSAGTYQLELVAGDSEFTVSDTLTVIVAEPSPANTAPQVDAGADDNALAGVAYQLNGSVTDDGVAKPLSVKWEAINGAQFNDASLPSATVTFATAGTYELQLSADDGEFSESDTVVITVAAPTASNTLPTADAGNDIEIVLSQAVELDGSRSLDSDGNLLAWEWRLSGGGLVGSGESVSWTPGSIGEKLVTLTVTDDRGGEASDTVRITVIAGKPDLDDYKLVFQDEFNGSKLDPAKWNTGFLWGPYQPINNEDQLYVDTLGINSDFEHSPFEFTGNSLKITATPTSSTLTPPVRPAENSSDWAPFAEYRFNGPTENDPGYQASDVDYLSGLITSYESFKMTHGYVETRAKLPAGQGLWPAFWLLTSHYVGDVPEIDVMEFLGDDPSTVYHTYHYFDVEDNWRAVSTPSFQSKADDWTQDFHVFGVAWSPRAIVWYVDGKEVRRITDSAYRISNQAMYLLANLAVGGSWPGSPDASTVFPAEFEIDYIRAYTKKLDEPINLDQHQLVFSDEFNGPVLDSQKWNTSFLWGPYLSINDEKQYYVDSLGADRDVSYSPFVFQNVNGKSVLSITAATAANSGPDMPPAELPDQNDSMWTEFPRYQRGTYAEAAPYTSGLITSYEAFKFVNGYAEINARIPVGDGLWPAFWLLNAYYVGPQPEIDVMEILGEDPGTLYHTYHRRGTNGVMSASQYISRSNDSELGFGDGFHRYGVHWQPGKITWYLDGKPVHSYSGSDVAYQMMYVIANLAVEGSFNNAPANPGDFPMQYDIDYIKVWQIKDPE